MNDLNFYSYKYIINHQNDVMAGSVLFHFMMCPLIVTLTDLTFYLCSSFFFSLKTTQERKKTFKMTTDLIQFFCGYFANAIGNGKLLQLILILVVMFTFSNQQSLPGILWDPNNPM